MENTSKEKIALILKKQRSFFASHATKNIDFRIAQLKKLREAIDRCENKITDALWADLRKSPQEAYLTEISIVLSEINLHIKKLKKWAKAQKVSTPIHLQPSKSRIVYEPLGVVLIIAPWNYPFQLLMNSLVGAISAGCCAVLKASPYASATAEIMQNLIEDTFPEDYIGFTQGNRDVNQLLLEQNFDFIFFTGSPSLGKKVMQAASAHLTPVVLELGGKSPCIVEKNADLKIAAKRIAWGKSINAGQTCIAPDYLFIHQSVKKAFVEHYKKAVAEMYGENIMESKYYPRIINEQAMKRLIGLMKEGNIVFGGDVNQGERYISPTLIDDVQTDFPIMQEEIFGPLLPMLSFEDINQVIDYVNSREKALALYYFGNNKKQAEELLLKTSSGGGCINDTLVHIANPHLPFGGVGNSGMGKYHGHKSFLVFSNSKSIIETPTWIDLALKYAPFKYFEKIKNLLR